MKTLLISLALLVCGCDCVVAQLITVQQFKATETIEQITTFSYDADGDGVADYSKPTKAEPVGTRASTVKLLTVNTEAANVTVRVSDKERNPVKVFSPKPNQYLFTAPGKYWVDVRAVDFAKNIYADEETIIDLGEPKPPAPDPSDIDNTYGLGVIALQYAPEGEAKTRLSRIFKEAGDFLFGIPTLKVVASANQNTSGNNVIVWLDKQMAMCSAEECKTFKAKIWEAFKASQQERQFSRQDWFNAFNEVSKALR